MANELVPVWTTAQKLLDSIEPCDIIEIRYKSKPPATHFVFNIKKGWCVHVIRAVDASGNLLLSECDNDGDISTVYEGIKDAVDLVSLAGGRGTLCRINNLEDIVKNYSSILTPRSRKDALQTARAALAEGAVISSIRSNIPGDNSSDEELAKQFCLYWKYNGAASETTSGHKFLDKTIAVCGLVLVLLAAVVATSLSM